MSKLTWAPAAFRRLNGVFCVYKPVGLPCFMVRDLINSYLVRGGCSLFIRNSCNKWAGRPLDKSV